MVELGGTEKVSSDIIFEEKKKSCVLNQLPGANSKTNSSFEEAGTAKTNIYKTKKAACYQKLATTGACAGKRD